jgi:hypothetical protein
VSNRDTLTREYSVFSDYLGSPALAPNSSVVDHYRAAHATLPADADRVDHWLLSFATRGVFACSLADAYARRVRPYGLLRRKLVLVLALLESGKATHASYDEALAAPMTSTLIALAVMGLWWLARTVIAVVVLAPFHLALRIASGGSRG